MNPALMAVGLGLVIGLVMALTGAGGGVLAVPLLVFGLHLSLQQAAPTGLVAVGAAAAVATVLGLREGIVRYRAAVFMSLFGMTVAPLGVWLAHQLPSPPLAAGFSGLLLIVAWRSFRSSETTERDQDDAPCRLDPTKGRLRWTARCARVLAGTGLTSGLLSGLFGVGGGFVIVPALSHISNLELRSIQATSLAVIALVSTSGVAAASVGGALAWSIALPFGAGAITALLLGRRLASGLHPGHLRQVFGMLTLVVSALMLARALGWQAS